MVKFFLRNRFLIAAACMLSVGGCYDAGTGVTPATKKDRYTYRETIVKGTDTGMISLGPFRRNNIADVLCQRWHLPTSDDESMDQMALSLTDSFLVDGVSFFKDSLVLVNPLGKMSICKWQVENAGNGKAIVIHLPDNTRIRYALRRLTSTLLVLSIADKQHSARHFVASAKVHRNMYNDPFHPVNNKWRVKPLFRESIQEIQHRLKNCLLFFALYYRDHIKRHAETISFRGLPEIFVWYNRGIGLPDKDELSDSWIDCFYDREQAEQGYSMLRKLIVDYEYKWPSRAPAWTYETHSVLEQMYHKIDALTIDSITGK